MSKRISKYVRAIATLLIFCSICGRSDFAVAIDTEIISRPSSYTEYFSEEVVWENPSIPDSMVDMYVFVASEDVFINTAGLTEGYLYRYSYLSGETTVLESSLVNDVRFLENEILFSHDKTITAMDINNTYRRTIFEFTASIGSFIPGSDLIFFESGGYLYRLHRASGVVDCLLSLDGVVSYDPLTNVSLIVRQIADDDTEVTRIVNTVRASSQIICDEVEIYDYLDNLASSNSVATYGITSVENWGVHYINGERVPVKIPVPYDGREIANKKTNTWSYVTPTVYYGEGTYFNLNYNQGNSNSSASLLFYGSSTCAGFARYVYAEIFGDADYGHYHKYNPNKVLNETSIAAFYRSLPAGTRMRLPPLGSSDGHSIIFVEADATGFIKYDANSDDLNGVKMVRYTYSEVVQAYKNYIANPSIRAHARKYCEIENIVTPTSPNSLHNAEKVSDSTHKACTYSGCHLENKIHTTTVQKLNAGHRLCTDARCSYYNLEPHIKEGVAGYGTCMICGYVGNISIGTASVGDDNWTE